MRRHLLTGLETVCRCVSAEGKWLAGAKALIAEDLNDVAELCESMPSKLWVDGDVRNWAADDIVMMKTIFDASLSTK